MDLRYKVEELQDACCAMVISNGYRECYLRPIVFRGYGTFGVDPFPSPLEVYVCAWPWGKYLGADAIERGVDVCVSSWARIAPNTLPAMAKAGANYMNSQLIKMEAKLNGYAEGIALDAAGTVSEGSGENIFLIRNETILTPPLDSTILPGITRDSVIKICHKLRIPVVEQAIPRELLYIADEVFFTGTAAEITPVRSVDKIVIGKGRRGPLTELIQREFFGITSGEEDDLFGWLTPVESAVAAPKVEST
jgi:branched-chain amino acid aminotransferase